MTQQVATRNPLPTASTLVKPLLSTLGVATNFQTRVFVPNKPIIQGTLRRAGYDIDHLSRYGTPEEGWNMYGRKNPEGLNRRAWRAFYMVHYKVKEPLIVTGPKMGLWGLTAEGVRAAKQSQGKKNQPNATSKFLAKRLRETGGLKGSLMTRLRITLSRKLPVSATYCRIEDHIQSCFLKLIANDAFRRRLEEGHKITDPQIVMFTVRHGFTEVRNAGTEPVEREFRGARTERERQKALPKPSCGKDPKMLWDRENYGEWDMVDLASGLRPEVTQDRMEFLGVWKQVEKVIRRKKIRVGGQSARVLWYSDVEGYTIKEIAELEGVSSHKASSLLAQARVVVREAVIRGQILPHLEGRVTQL